jgi:GPH family glycoside/pentoside/hexuronide:cation symporter
MARIRGEPGPGVGAPCIDSRETRISAGRLLAYSLPAAPLAVMLLPLNALLPFFYNSVLGLNAAIVGLVLLAVRLADVVLDPLIGALSDVTRSRLGRRRSWMAAGTPLFVGGAWALFHPPAVATAWYLLTSAFAVYAGWTMIQLPFLAWGAEAVTGYEARARLTGFREAGTIVGTVLAALVPVLCARSGHGIDRFTIGIIGWCLVVTTPPLVALSFFSLPDPQLKSDRRWTALPFSPRQLLTFGRPFQMILAAFICIGLAKGVSNALTVYFATFVLKAPEVVGYVLFSAYLGLLFGTPIWVRLSGRIGKHRAVAISLMLSITVLLGCAAVLGPGDGWLFVGLEFGVGLCASGYIVLPAAVIADAVDHDTLKGGRERFGLHFATWSMAQKLVNALAVGIALPILSLLRLDPARTPVAMAVGYLRFAYLVLPAPLFIAGAFLFWHFPIDRRRHQIIRRRLGERVALAASLA